MTQGLIYALVTLNLDYFNALYEGLSLKSIQQLQLMQNAAAGVVNGICDNIPYELHWLPCASE